MLFFVEMFSIDFIYVKSEALKLFNSINFVKNFSIGAKSHFCINTHDAILHCQVVICVDFQPSPLNCDMENLLCTDTRD